MARDDDVIDYLGNPTTTSEIPMTRGSVDPLSSNMTTMYSRSNMSPQSLADAERNRQFVNSTSDLNRNRSQRKQTRNASEYTSEADPYRRAGRADESANGSRAEYETVEPFRTSVPEQILDRGLDSSAYFDDGQGRYELYEEPFSDDFTTATNVHPRGAHRNHPDMDSYSYDSYETPVSSFTRSGTLNNSHGLTHESTHYNSQNPYNATPVPHMRSGAAQPNSNFDFDPSRSMESLNPESYGEAPNPTLINDHNCNHSRVRTSSMDGHYQNQNQYMIPNNYVPPSPRRREARIPVGVYIRDEMEMEQMEDEVRDNGRHYRDPTRRETMQTHGGTPPTIPFPIPFDTEPINPPSHYSPPQQQRTVRQSPQMRTADLSGNSSVRSVRSHGHGHGHENTYQEVRTESIRHSPQTRTADLSRNSSVRSVRSQGHTTRHEEIREREETVKPPPLRRQTSSRSIRSVSTNSSTGASAGGGNGVGRSPTLKKKKSVRFDVESDVISPVLAAQQEATLHRSTSRASTSTGTGSGVGTPSRRAPLDLYDTPTASTSTVMEDTNAKKNAVALLEALGAAGMPIISKEAETLAATLKNLRVSLSSFSD